MGIRVVFMSVPELAGIFLCGDYCNQNVTEGNLLILELH